MVKKTVILVVEDEAIIRMGIVQLLEDEGFMAVEASNAHDAVVILESRNDVQVIFTDINMPGTLDGMRLARLVRNRWPPIHIIVTSGLIYPNDDDLPPGGRFIRKPYEPKQVLATLRELLDQTPPAAGPLQHTGRAA